MFVPEEDGGGGGGVFRGNWPLWRGRGSPLSGRKRLQFSLFMLRVAGLNLLAAGGRGQPLTPGHVVDIEAVSL